MNVCLVRTTRFIQHKSCAFVQRSYKCIDIPTCCITNTALCLYGCVHMASLSIESWLIHLIILGKSICFEKCHGLHGAWLWTSAMGPMVSFMWTHWTNLVALGPMGCIVFLAPKALNSIRSGFSTGNAQWSPWHVSRAILQEAHAISRRYAQ